MSEYRVSMSEYRSFMSEFNDSMSESKKQLFFPKRVKAIKRDCVAAVSLSEPII